MAGSRNGRAGHQAGAQRGAPATPHALTLPCLPRPARCCQPTKRVWGGSARARRAPTSAHGPAAVCCACTCTWGQAGWWGAYCQRAQAAGDAPLLHGTGPRKRSLHIALQGLASCPCLHKAVAAADVLQGEQGPRQRAAKVERQANRGMPRQKGGQGTLPASAPSQRHRRCCCGAALHCTALRTQGWFHAG